jgi:3-(3-hydroxy-phenyl)propionate hydroxylase
VIAADGPSGQTRAQVGLGFAGMTFPDNFIATNVRFDFSRLGLALNNYVIDPQLGAVVAKVSQDGLCRVTWAEDAQLPDSGLKQRIHQFLTALTPRGANYELVDHSRYRMHQRAAESMRCRSCRVWRRCRT